MSEAADGGPSYAVSIRAGEPGASPLVEKRGVDPRSDALLRHERAVLAAVSHPNIIELAGRFRPTTSDDSSPLTTFLAGRSTLADQPLADPLAVTRAAVQLATTVAELHDMGWAHGSICAEHCLVSPDGALVWCSLRRASAIGGPDAPAATRDVAALVALIATMIPASAARSGPTRALAAVVGGAANRTPTARRLADELAVVLGDQRPARPRPRPRRPKMKLPHRARPRHRRPSPLPGVIGRMLVCAAAGWLAWRLNPGGAHGIGATDDLAPPLRVAADVLRWAAMIAAGYGFCIGGLTGVALVSRSGRLSSAAERLGPSVLRRWMTGVTSLGVLGATIGTAGGAGPPRTTVVQPVPRRHQSRPTTTARPPSTTAPLATSTTTQPAATTTPAAPSTPAASSTHVTPLGPLRPDAQLGSLAAAPATPARAALPPVPRTWTTAPGDDLWSIAERVLVLAGHARPTNPEIGRYWQALMAANHDSVPDPDLIYPGQVLEVPAVDWS